MSDEQLLAERQDEWGVLRVIEVGAYRFLEFGDDAVEQSCTLIADPAWLEYDYTRAMLLGSLLPEEVPNRLLFLGLGAGSLTMACRYIWPHAHMEAVELRPAVVELAHDFMGLAHDARMTVRIGDAVQMLSACQTADVVFLDLYTDQGPAAAHVSSQFLRECHAHVRPGGWLVINQWSTAEGRPVGAALLRGTFGYNYWECPLLEGNVVLFIPAEAEAALPLARWLARSEALIPQLGYDPSLLLERLRAAR